METEKTMKIAVLIDAENISYKYAKLILDEASNFGAVTCRRIYGDWSSAGLSSWRSPIMDYSINAIQQFQNTSGKNSTDSALIIDAMDLLHEGKYQGICIVSSDSDFTRLASRLREAEVYVVGMGEQKTPAAFRSACDKFLYLDVLFNKDSQPVTQDVQENAEEVKASVLQEPMVGNGLNIHYVISVINDILINESDEDGWVYMSELGNRILAKIPDFDVRNFRYPKLGKFIQSIPSYEIKTELSPTDSSKTICFVKKKVLSHNQ